MELIMRIFKQDDVVIVTSKTLIWAARRVLPKVHALPLKYFVLLDPFYHHHVPIIAHEVAHIEQQRFFGFFSFLRRYRECKNFRWNCEVQAHLAEYKAGGEMIEIVYKFKARYGLEARDGGTILDILRRYDNGRSS